MICELCKYQYADCKGEKGSVRCPYFKKPIAFNAHDIAERVSVLEDENARLKGFLQEISLKLDEILDDIDEARHGDR